jgi:hypothetical protein
MSRALQARLDAQHARDAVKTDAWVREHATEVEPACGEIGVNTTSWSPFRAKIAASARVARAAAP